MKVRSINVEKLKNHSWQDSIGCNDIWCMKAHLIVLVPSVMLEDGSKWVGVKEVFDFDSDEMIAVNVRMGRLHEELKIKYLEEEKPKQQPSICYCLGPNAADCPVHNKVFCKCTCCKFGCHPCSVGCDGLWKK